MNSWKKEITEVDLDVIYFEYHSCPSEITEVFVWDYDKTYIESNPETLKGFYKAATEPAEKKETVKGVIKKLQSVVAEWESHNPGKKFPLYFVTASPPQAVHKIISKIRLDGFEPLGIYCKNNLRNFRPSRWKMIYNHIGYKLHAFYKIWEMAGENVMFNLWGDNSEHDYFVFSLLSDYGSGKMTDKELFKTLESYKIKKRQIERIQKINKNLPTKNPIKAAYIRKVKLDRVLPDRDSFYFHS